MKSHCFNNWLRAILSAFVSLAVLTAPLHIPSANAQPSESQKKAKNYYKEGAKRYSSGDYQGAIAEFAAAERMVPSPLLGFNIALCYDKLGDFDEALRRYQIYLKDAPNAQNRGAVEVKIRRIEGVLRVQAAAEQKEQEAQAAKLRKKKAAEEKAAALETASTPPPLTEPLSKENRPTKKADTFLLDDLRGTNNDPELARVASVDVAAIRNQRREGQAGRTPSEEAPSSLPPVHNKQSDRASDPFYKKWWFWVVAGAGLLILREYARSDSSSSDRVFQFQSTPMFGRGSSTGGLEWRF